MSTINYTTATLTIDDLVRLYQDGKLNLEPGFQRRSVWNPKDRAKLIDSIINNYPLPSIFLYKRETDGEIHYDVIDGKQRIESIFYYLGIIKGKKFKAKFQLPDTEEVKEYDYTYLKKLKKQNIINGYILQKIEVDGDFADIIHLFIRINSTGKALTSSEKRHANYNKSEFLKKVQSLADFYADYFISNKILSKEQINRMKHIELMLELMLSIHIGDVINKKSAIDKIMKSDEIKDKRIKNLTSEVKYLFNFFKKNFPELKTTRFHQLSDFYSLFVLFAKFKREKFILTDKVNNKIAWELLKKFSNGVDEVRLYQKKVEKIPEGYELYREYLFTVILDSDSMQQRKKREDILTNILSNLYQIKDKNRFFSIEQRRIIWNSDEERICTNCGAKLTWNNFTIDHINPYSTGGKTILNNASIMCRSCNSKKGNRVKSK